MRYAIVASGGKQYVAREGEILEVDRLGKPAGDTVDFEQVLLAAEGEQVLVGSPVVAGARVRGTIQGEIRGEKVVVFRYQPKKRRRRKLGHRQTYSRVRIESIDLPGMARTDGAGLEKKAAPRKKAAAKKPAAPAARKTSARPAAKKKG